MMLVSPAEPRHVRDAIGLHASSFGKVAVNGLPEQSGADFLFSGAGGLVGVQRKAYPSDFCASVRDGRLQREMWLLLQKCWVGVLLLEGDPFDPMMGRSYTAWTPLMVRNLLLSVQLTGIACVWVADVEGTIEWLAAAMRYFQKEQHDALLMRPKSAARDGWGALDVGSLVLQSFPGVGPKTAAAILEKFGGRLPLQWTCGIEELLAVDGVGKKTAQRLLASLGNEDSV